MNFDLERMKKALEGPFYTKPKGLTREEFRQFMKDCKDGKIKPNG